MFRKQFFILLIITLALTSCTHHSQKVARAFYYWRSTFNLNDSDLAYLKNVEASRLYLHFFDVTWDTKVMPVAKMEFASPPPKAFEYVPVVYITIKALENTSADSIAPLARHIYNEVEHIANANSITYKEVQIDCDWTESTMKKYFALLTTLHESLKGKTLSATIRLHQIKYPKETGIPPIDRGMLMFYNMGKINAVHGYNSIYNTTDADKYASYISSYPLPLDLALPIYSWAILIRDGKVNNLLQKTSATSFADTAHFQSHGNDIFVSRSSFFLHGNYFMKNDTLKIESVNPTLCEDAATNATRYLKPENRTVSLFEFDSLYISSYEKTDIEKIYSAAR